MLALLPFTLVLLPPLLAVAASWLGPAGAWGVPVFYLVLLPLCDGLVGPSATGAPAPGPAALHRALLHASVPLVLGLTAWLAWHTRALPPLEYLGWVFTAGTVTSLGIPIAHELIHKASRVDRAAGKLLLFNAAYMHFAIEHVFGHHVRVATPDDPATARRGESVYAFYPRAVLGGWRSAWAIEAARLQRVGARVWGPRNQMLWFAMLPLGYAALLTFLVDPQSGMFFLAQAVVGFSLLELVSYLEHYGLERAPGERVTPMHSWSSGRRLSNWAMVNLQLHADHHMRAGVPYQVLEPLPGAPEMPTSYGGMALIALVPPLFFRVMDPRVRRVADGPP